MGSSDGLEQNKNPPPNFHRSHRLWIPSFRDLTCLESARTFPISIRKHPMFFFPVPVVASPPAWGDELMLVVGRCLQQDGRGSRGKG